MFVLTWNVSRGITAVLMHPQLGQLDHSEYSRTVGIIGLLTVHLIGFGPPAHSRRCLRLNRKMQVDTTVLFYIHSGHRTQTHVWYGGIRWRTSTIKRRNTTRRNHVFTAEISSNRNGTNVRGGPDTRVILMIIQSIRVQCNCERPASFHTFADYLNFLFFVFPRSTSAPDRSDFSENNRNTHIVYLVYNARITITSVRTNSRARNVQYTFI